MGSADVQVVQLKIALREVEPAVWRRIQVRRQVRLDRLHFDYSGGDGMDKLASA
jgi:hypothetical protein